MQSKAAFPEAISKMEPRSLEDYFLALLEKNKLRILRFCAAYVNNRKDREDVSRDRF
ncbi:hypothetical protein MJD09_18220 [bacterium]|nr:hypothetical protein [bacterium]